MCSRDLFWHLGASKDQSIFRPKYQLTPKKCVTTNLVVRNMDSLLSASYFFTKFLSCHMLKSCVRFTVRMEFQELQFSSLLVCKEVENLFWKIYSLLKICFMMNERGSFLSHIYNNTWRYFILVNFVSQIWCIYHIWDLCSSLPISAIPTGVGGQLIT